MLYLVGHGRDFQKLSYGSKILGLTSDGLGEMLEENFTDVCTHDNGISSENVKHVQMETKDPH